jgi:FkbM family methyltransferase
MDTFNVKFQAQMNTEGKDQLIQGADIVLGGEYECGVNAHHVRILDIGGNIGAFTIWALHRFPFSTVQVFEPVPEVFELLEENLKFYKSMVTTYPWAVCSTKELVLTVNPDKLENTGKYSDRFVTMANSYQIKVKTIDPAAILEAGIVKVDCEGFEEEVITRLSLDRTFLLIVEFHSDIQRTNVEKYLYGKGFLLYWTNQAPFYGLSGICFYLNPNVKADYSLFRLPRDFSV